MTRGGGSNNQGSVFKYDPYALAINTVATMVNCYGTNTGTATASVAGGTPSYTYSWNSTPVQTTQTATGLSAGSYLVTVTDANSNTKTASVSIAQPNIIGVTISPSNATCDNSGSASAMVTGGTSPYSYLWSNGQTTSAAIGLGGVNYTLTVTDSLGCIGTQTIVIANNPPIVPSICAVTVDSLSQYNIIVWDKTAFPIADTFLVYRDTANNAYGLIGKVPYISLSMFTDTARTLYAANGDPNVSSWKYKIAVKDTCGNISVKSPYHKTLFTQNNTGNFSWNNYQIEGQPLPVPALSNYLFQRDNLSNGNWATIQTLSASSLAYTDPQYLTYHKALPPERGNIMEYQLHTYIDKKSAVNGNHH